MLEPTPNVEFEDACNAVVPCFGSCEKQGKYVSFRSHRPKTILHNLPGLEQYLLDRDVLDQWKHGDVRFQETQIAALQLQGFSPIAESREGAVLEHFGRLLFDTTRQFEHLNEVAEITVRMNQILAMATHQYERRLEGQSVLEKGGFAFDGLSYGNKCNMALKVIDEPRGAYRLVLKGSVEN